jgi:hypothetical protein
MPTDKDVLIVPEDFQISVKILLSLADDMYVTLINEIGNTVAASNYKKYLDSIS